MKIYDNCVRNSDQKELNEALNQPVFQQRISVWQAEKFFSKKRNKEAHAFNFLNERRLNEMIIFIAKPDLTPEEVKQLVQWAKEGDIDAKLRLPAFSLSTFNPDQLGRIKRVSRNCKTFTNLVQIDLDLKNEPNCTPEYITKVQNRLFELKLAPYIALCAKSISGKGLYFFITTNSSNKAKLDVFFSKINKLLQQEFNFQHDKTLDPCTKDYVTRLRYYAPDSDIIINKEVKEFDVASITVPIKQVKSVTVPDSVTDEIQILKKNRTRFLKDYSTTVYVTGFHEIFSKKFCPACLGEGVSLEVLKIYVLKVFGNLYKDGYGSYFDELERVIDYWKNNFQES